MKKKESRYRLECYQDGVEGIFRYHRARRMLGSCLFLPPLAGAIYALDDPLLGLLLLPVLFFSKTSLHRMTDLAVYGMGGSWEDKSERARGLLREDVRHNLICIALVLAATTVLLALGRQGPRAAIEAVRLGEALQFSYVFLFGAILLLRLSLADIVTKLPRRLFAVWLTYYFGSFLLLYPSHEVPGSLFVPFAEEGVVLLSPAEYFTLRLSLTVLPVLVCLLFLLRWLADVRRRDDRLHATYLAANTAWVFLVFAHAFIWEMPMALFPVREHWFLREPTAGMWLGALLLLACAVVAGWTMAFMQSEKIRRGLCFDPDAMYKTKRMWWPFRDRRPHFSTRWIRRRITQASKPLLGTPRHWKRVRRVRVLGERPWAVGLLSSLVTAYFLFG
ncbi:MAG: hypothetical protein ISN26_06235 [Betaproteobacteria bacterium AqS2]|uniref:Uncharacterized protein n=1 Tax=Candidatus Amphirhobacter heronislandensis TaxID=1732024 RepID=A0A930Y1S2_9GAMM|nr:hypothetical protein [Betaproteobacteria bacterium AqS2]